MSRLWSIAGSILASGGILGAGSIGGYIGDTARRALGAGLSSLTDNGVYYFSKDKEILKRALIQVPSHLLYGAIRSYPRFMQYWEQKERDKYLQTTSQTSITNETGQYFKLIEEQKAVAKEKNYTVSPPPTTSCVMYL